MTTNDLAKMILERVIRVQKLSATPAQAAAAAQKLALWIAAQRDGFTAEASETQADLLVRLEANVWDLAVSSELVRVGAHWEDNSDIISELFYIEAVDARGRRFRSYFIDKDEVQERLALITLDGGIDPIKSKWTETYPVYGSAAYVSQGTEAELLAMERREEGL